MLGGTSTAGRTSTPPETTRRGKIFHYDTSNNFHKNRSLKKTSSQSLPKHKAVMGDTSTDQTVPARSLCLVAPAGLAPSTRLCVVCTVAAPCTSQIWAARSWDPGLRQENKPQAGLGRLSPSTDTAASTTPARGGQPRSRTEITARGETGMCCIFPELPWELATPTSETG